MSIHDKEDRFQEQKPEQQQAQQQQAPHNAQTPFSFHNGGGTFGPISRIIGSDVYTKLKEALCENYKEVTDKNTEISIIDMDNVNEVVLAFSSLVIAMRDKSRPASPVKAYVLILEATGTPLSPVIENLNGRQVERLRTPGHAFDSVLKHAVVNKLRKLFNVNVDIVGATVVPTAFDAADKYAVHKLALNAGLACYTDFAMENDEFQDIDLTKIERDGSLVINIGYTNQQLEDAVGNKMRSDVLVNFESRKANQDNRMSVNSGDREVKISELSGFVDLLWAPSADQMFNPYQQAQAQASLKYAARFVITNLTSNVPYTLRSLLLNIGTSLALQDNNSWIQTFKPSTDTNEAIDLRDIGALNIDANIGNEATEYGRKIDTKADAFKLEDLGQLVAAMIKPRLMISVDCPIVGPQSWYLNNLAIAATNSPQSAEYSSAIYNAAFELTGGIFANNFSHGAPIFENIEDYVHNGHWTDKNGNIRDIRDIDYLAVCNLVGERNPQYIREWSDTFNDMSTPILQRLETRKRMISLLTYDTAVFTGFSQRVTFTPMFLDALSKSIEETGIPVRINTPLTGNDFVNRRASASFITDSLLQPGRSFATAGFSQQHNQYGYGIDPRFM